MKFQVGDIIISNNIFNDVALVVGVNSNENIHYLVYLLKTDNDAISEWTSTGMQKEYSLVTTIFRGDIKR